METLAADDLRSINELLQLKKHKEEQLQAELSLLKQQLEQLILNIGQLEASITHTLNTKHEFVNNFYQQLQQELFKHSQIQTLDIELKKFQSQVEELTARKMRQLKKTKKIKHNINQIELNLKQMIVQQEKYKKIISGY